MTHNANPAPLTVQIPPNLLSFLERYRQDHTLESQDEIIFLGLRHLQQLELAQAYQAHALEWATHPDRDFWDRAALDDGLES